MSEKETYCLSLPQRDRIDVYAKDDDIYIKQVDSSGMVDDNIISFPVEDAMKVADLIRVVFEDVTYDK